MKLKVKEFNVYLDETILIVVFLCIFFKEMREYFENYFICYLFITFHELSHMFVASIFGIKTTRVRLSISGLNINLNNNKKYNVKWLAIFLAGPISNIILALMFKNISMVYTINLALAIINLIPIYPLDGYNIFEIILKLVKAKKIVKIKNIVEFMVIIILGNIGIYQLIFFKNPSLILMSFYIFIQRFSLRNNWDSRMYQKYYKNITIF